MDIYWLGHAAFRLRSITTGLSIITDPYTASSGLGMQIDSRQIVDVVGVTVSHDDAMHNNPADLGGDARVFNTPGEYEFQGITIRAVMTGLPEGVPRSQRNVAYTISIDGISVCHLGSIARPLTAQQIDLIGPADVVLAPAGGEDRNLLSYRAINQTAQQLDARWLVPMHFRAPGESSGIQPEDPRAFLRELGVADGSLQPQGRMQVTRNNLPPSLQIGLLTPQIRSR
ncbi:MAG: MBL fold metallo-hydrolase [Chloroflexi bacterium]|nr:MBL fold metallo-hydrolase [Chloroflexota bacterium]